MPGSLTRRSTTWCGRRSVTTCRKSTEFQENRGQLFVGLPHFFGIHGTVRDFVETLVLLPPSKFTWGIANLTPGRDASKEVHMREGDPPKYVRAAIGVAAFVLLMQVLPTP